MGSDVNWRSHHCCPCPKITCWKIHILRNGAETQEDSPAKMAGLEIRTNWLNCVNDSLKPGGGDESRLSHSGLWPHCLPDDTGLTGGGANGARARGPESNRPRRPAGGYCPQRLPVPLGSPTGGQSSRSRVSLLHGQVSEIERPVRSAVGGASPGATSGTHLAEGRRPSAPTSGCRPALAAARQ